MNSVTRTLSVVSATFVLVLAGASASFADAPTTWEDGPTTDFLYYLTLLVAIPAGLFVVVSLFGLLTAPQELRPAGAVDRGREGRRPQPPPPTTDPPPR
ncbi:MAG: hypothetical protein PGN07_04385 [Aeromicrobium erythreum]